MIKNELIAIVARYNGAFIFLFIYGKIFYYIEVEYMCYVILMLYL